MTTVLIATDSDAVAEQVSAALGSDENAVLRVRSGADVLPAVKDHLPDLVLLDLQIGNMGGVATCLELHNEAGAGRIDQQRVILLLDREADVFLAGRSQADGWLVKPMDPFRLRRAADAVLAGSAWEEGTEATATG